MKRLLLLGGLLASLIICGPARAYTITNDPGGRIVDFYRRYDNLRNNGAPVIIDGLCASACTLVTALVPSQNVCITPRARLGFHSAFDLFEGGRTKFSPIGTSMLWSVYPQRVKQLLLARGWNGHTPHPDVIWIDYSTLRSMYRTCT